jgi:hypothetical protein
MSWFDFLAYRQAISLQNFPLQVFGLRHRSR